MNTKVMIFPHRYVQGPNTLKQIGDHLEILGVKKPLIVGGPTALSACRESIQQSITAKGMACVFQPFGGETTWKEIGKIKRACQSGGHDAIISCGGGKVLDAGRTAAAAYAVNAGVTPPQVVAGVGAGVLCIQVPTIAATDAPTAKVSVIYDEKGAFETFLVFPTNPAMVFVDTEVIAKAPVTQLVSGMGDALATYFEADISYRTATPVLAGGQCSRTALMIAKLAFDTLMQYGLQAKIEVENKIAGPALEAIVEANILLSGLGYENGGLGAAHAIALSYTRIYPFFQKHPSHGQFVAFSTLAQLMMEERSREWLDQIYGFCRSVGLPITFEQLGASKLTDDALKMVAEDAAKSVLILSMPKARTVADGAGRFYDPGEIFNCLKAADAYGRAFMK